VTENLHLHPINLHARVAAIVPHYGRDEQCNEWLGNCLESLKQQTVEPESIVVVDDHSPHPPDKILAQFSGISLFRNSCNTGPLAIQNYFFQHLSADAVMMQDSDDWSDPRRLEILIAKASESGAELVGCQITNVAPKDEIIRIPPELSLPEDPLPFLLENPTAHLVVLPSSLISTALVRRLGGLASGLRFGGDSEFVRRAILTNRVVNIQEALYFRRVHNGSLTQRPDTGMTSPARQQVRQLIQARAKEQVQAYLNGLTIPLEPIKKGQLLRLKHVRGPIPAGVLPPFLVSELAR
jgi:glycosyltransferase involved in cell wall biosynthesis